jgi:hypothetical protein
MRVEDIVRKPDRIVASATGKKTSDDAIWCENALPDALRDLIRNYSIKDCAVVAP